MIPLVVMFWAGLLTVAGTHAACDRVARQWRLARYRHRWLRATRPLDGNGGAR